MRPPLAVPLVVVGSVAAGVALSFGQGSSVEAIAPLFNSALPVVTLAAVAALAGRRLWACVVLAAMVGPLAMVGYYSTSAARGLGASSSWALLWIGAGVVAGSAMGGAVWSMRQPSTEAPEWWVRALAVGYWPGLALGEAAHGLTRVADSTPSAYWWVQACAGAVVLVVLAATRLASSAARLVAIGSTIAVSASLYLVYGAF